MERPLRVLIVDDSEDDALVMICEIRRAGYALQFARVDTAATMHEALDRGAWDVILAGNTPPRFSASDALALVQQRGLEIPLIITTGAVSEDVPADPLSAGAYACVLKHDLARLVPAIEGALRQAGQRPVGRLAEPAPKPDISCVAHLLTSTPVMLYGADPHRDFARTFISPNIRERLGYGQAEFSSDPRFWINRVHPADAPRVLAQFRSLAEKGQIVCEYRFLHKNGEYRRLRDECRLIPDATGQLRKIAGYCLDVTRSQTVEEDLLQADRLETIGSLACGIAHDFNNILTGITGLTQLVLDQVESDSPLRRDVEEIRELADRAVGMTQRLLTFSHRQPVQMTTLDLNGVVEDVTKMLVRLVGEDVELELKLAPEAGHIRGDVGQIEQVLMNLGVNARDAMPDGGKLTIETAIGGGDRSVARSRTASLAEDCVQLIVTDTGHGMDEATQEYIFEPYFTTKGKGRGSGLGLATVRSIVAQSGGTIDVHSQPGRGSTFTIRLPRVDSAGHRPDGEPGGQVPEGTQTLLLVQDDRTVRAAASRTLSEQGYAVLTAASAEEAERVFSRQHAEIALLVTDLVLPECSGRELFERLARQQPSLRALFMFGHPERTLRDRGITNIGMPLAQKPLTPDLLACRVRDTLGRSPVLKRTG